jgi:hypothetical protein
LEAVRVGYLVSRGAISSRKEATPMGDLCVDTPNAPPVVSPEEMAGRFHGELMGAMPDWKRRLGEDPSRLPELEHEVRDAFSRGADLVVAGLIALVMKQAGFDGSMKPANKRGGTTAFRFPVGGCGRCGFACWAACWCG